MSRQRQITQLLDKNNQPTRPAVSAPGWFVFDGVDIPGQSENQTWGEIFSFPRKGNKVECYVTGQEYFDAVAAAIAAAKKSVFITGWQVNFDVIVTRAGKTLLQILDEALNHADVFVMPWMSPKVGLDTGDFETMLAIHHLNVGRTGGKRARCIPAMAQSDMAAGLNAAFAHHQKLVVIDNEIAFMGGIDLAYGRRDNGALALEAGGREGNELYSTCIAPTDEISHAQSSAYLTRAELLAACFEGKLASTAQFLLSTPWKPLGTGMDGAQVVGDTVRDGMQYASNWWNTSDLVPQFLRQAQDWTVDQAQAGVRWGYHELDDRLRGQLERLRQSGSAHVADAATLIVAWLNNANLSAIPPQFLEDAGRTFKLAVTTMLRLLSSGAANRKERYANLFKLGRMLPSGKVPDARTQPRMPWHDVHCRIEGAAVYDLSNNFVRRWNSLAKGYESDSLINDANSVLNAIYSVLGIQLGTIKPLRFEQIPQEHVPKPVAVNAEPKLGSAWVQVLRSAPKTLLRQENVGADVRQAPAPAHAQNNCLKAMLRAIQSAQNFIYIEGQFFQCAHGKSSINPADKPSGPMGALTDIRMTPRYRQYARMLGIEGVPVDQIAERLIWSKIDDVRRDAKGEGADFVNDVMRVIDNVRNEQIMRRIGPEQKELLNPVGLALVARIERAVLDKLPFHVYLLLPVHPEGKLDTVEVMAQMHLTMQSLAYGEDSLLNGVRRAIVMGDNFFGKKMPLARARAEARKLGFGEKLTTEVGDRWKQYLTLLNLRNWTTLGGRPVTEQCYVHSKLLIADDRVAVLGSANINDRSMQGDRDSELAVIITDDTKAKTALDGKHAVDVGQVVHDLRKRLWKKHFGLTDGAKRPASQLAGVLDQPAAQATWQAIQAVAESNGRAYSGAFKFVPKTEAFSSIWPTWSGDRLQYHMPFNERFWREDKIRDECFTWDAKQRAPESEPKNVQGFIVALPIQWTENENNRSRINLTVLAEVDPPASRDGTALATLDGQNAGKGETV